MTIFYILAIIFSVSEIIISKFSEKSFGYKLDIKKIIYIFLINIFVYYILGLYSLNVLNNADYSGDFYTGLGNFLGIITIIVVFLIPFTNLVKNILVSLFVLGTKKSGFKIFLKSISMLTLIPLVFVILLIILYWYISFVMYAL